MKTRPATKYALLGALGSGAKHGYEILQYFETYLGSTWYVSTSQLYVLLKRLEEQGWVESSVALQEMRPSKRVFSLTPKGSKAFEKWLFSTTEHVRDLRVEFLAKLFFIKHLRLKGGKKLVAAQIRVLESLREKLLATKKPDDDDYQKLVLDAKVTAVESWIAWLEKRAEKFIQI
jgi:PadR family transcriptional regulator, regulatory protein AphA